jgi:DNA-binding transcriptional ArsR family regulator
MSTIFPLREKVSLDDKREPRLVDLDDVADEVFQALSSGTTRNIFASLHETPQTASDLAEVTDTSVQNAQYHLQKLVDADLVEVVDTWYSERGTEMKVYAPTDESLVLYAGNDKQGSLRSLLKRVVGVLGMLLPASAIVAWFAGQVVDQPSPEPAPYTDSSTEVVPESSGDAGVSMTTDGGDVVNNTTTPTETASGAVDALWSLDPAIAAGTAFSIG